MKRAPVKYASAVHFAMELLGTALVRGDERMPKMGRLAAAELGRLLQHIADGGDPHALRVRSTSPSPIAVAYWYHYRRVTAPGFSDRVAVEGVRREDFQELATSTIRKYGQTHRDHVLDALERGVPPFDYGAMEDDPTRKFFADFAARVRRKHLQRIRRYREYLRKKSARGDVENLN